MVSVKSVKTIVRSMGGNDAVLIGTEIKTSVLSAAWANGVSASALDMDDGSFWKFGHAGHYGSMVVPACLSISESERLSGRDLIEAVVKSYEIGIRSGYIISFLKVSHNGGPMGCYGATAAAAKLLRLSLSNGLIGQTITEELFDYINNLKDLGNVRELMDKT